MNKTLRTLCLCSFVAARNSHAVTLHKDQDITVRLGGDFQVQLLQAPGSEQELGLDNDDLALKFGVKYSLESGMSAFGQLDMDWKRQGDGSDDDVVDKAFVGVGFGMLSIALGRMPWGSDALHAEQAVEFDAGSAFTDTAGSDTVQLKFSGADIIAVLSTELEEGGDQTATDVYIGTATAGVDVAVAYQRYQASQEDSEVSAGEKTETLGLVIRFELGPTAFAIDYSSNTALSAINASASTALGSKTRAALGLTHLSPNQGDAELHWYANLRHKLHKQVSAFAEIGDSNIEDSELGLLSGIRIKF